MAPSGLRLTRISCVTSSARPYRSLQRTTCGAWATTSRRWNSSQRSGDSPKPFYVTTPIFYVNAAPHIGHLYSMVVADVFKRYQELKGNSAFLSTGTDEHGMKIQRAAIREDMSPQTLCDTNADKFLRLTEAGAISHDTFIRTTAPEHKAAVATFYQKMRTNPDRELGLYKGSHAGWYSVSDECFYPEDLVEAAIEPQTGRRMKVSTETGSEVEWVDESTWFFPLTKFKEALLKFYDENPGWIQPEHKMKEVRNWVENHLEDLSVTRPAARLQWGIKDPGDSKNTIYVWVDALINYLTVSGYGDSWTLPGHRSIWPADVHVVGKDIIRFHAVYWPAMLMALGLPLPKKVLCHNHWTMSNRKMSKSVGNVVNPFFAIQRWGAEPLRYFLMRNGSLQKDSSYSNEIVAAVYTKELQANIGNLLYRLARPKANARWAIGEAVEAFAKKDFEENAHLADPTVPERHFWALESTIDQVKDVYVSEMDSLNVGKALDALFGLMKEANAYISLIEPWKLVKSGAAADRIKTNWAIFNTTEALRVAAILLLPIMPSKATIILDELAVRPERRTLQWAAHGADTQYGRSRDDPLSQTRVVPWDSVFPPVASLNLTDREAADQGKITKRKAKIEKKT